MSGFARGLLVGAAATVVAGASLAVVTPISFEGPIAQARGRGPLWHEAPAPAEDAVLPQPSFAPLIKKLKPAVVSISTRSMVRVRAQDPFEEFFRRFLGEPPMRRDRGEELRSMPRSLGSGFIIHETGLVLTNNHVIERADEILVKLADGREFQATVVGRDPKTDVALLRLDDASDLPTVVLGDSDALEVGDWVLAIGNPFGLSHSVSTGIVSAKERFIGAGPYDDFIQTDAAINPGNSGGPLFNIRGEVIGINTAIVAHGQGIGFAVPINLVKALIPQLEEKGHVTRGWLGVMIQDLNENLAETLGVPGQKGALIAEVVEGSPAEKAGLQHGDLVVSVDGRTIEGYAQLSRTIALLPPGSTAKIGIIRNGKRMEIPVTIAEREEDTQLAVSRGGQGGPSETSKRLGITVQEVPPEIGRRLRGGVLVSAVEQGGPAASAGVARGDVLLEINRRPIRSLAEFREVMRNVSAGEMTLLRLQRGDAAIYVAVRASN